MVGFEKKRVVFQDFAFAESKKNTQKSNLLVATESENCEIVNGEIRTGVGLTPYLLNGEQVGFASYYPSANFYFLLPNKGADGAYTKTLGCVSSDGTLLVFTQANKSWNSVHRFKETIKGCVVTDLRGEGRLILTGDSGAYAYDPQSGVTALSLQEKVKAVCAFQGRVFCAVEPWKIVYGEPFEPKIFQENIEGSGSISLPTDFGNIEALLPIGEKLYLFFEYGIFQIQGGGSARDFTVKRVEYGGGKIFGQSLGVCAVGGEKAVFLAENGLYLFDGNGVKPIAENLFVKPKREGQVCVHGRFNGKYYLCYVQEDGQKTGLVLDMATGNGYKAFAEETVGECEGQAVCRGELYLQRFCEDGDLPNGVQSRFFVKDLDFGTNERKRLRALKLSGNGSVEVVISCGTKRKRVTLTDFKREFFVGFLGKRFDLELILDKGARVTGVEAETEYLKGNVKRRWGNAD